MIRKKFSIPDRTPRATRRTPPCRATRAPRAPQQSLVLDSQNGSCRERRSGKRRPGKRPLRPSVKQRSLFLQAGARVRAFINDLQEFEHVTEKRLATTIHGTLSEMDQVSAARLQLRGVPCMPRCRAWTSE